MRFVNDRHVQTLSQGMGRDRSCSKSAFEARWEVEQSFSRSRRSNRRQVLLLKRSMASHDETSLTCPWSDDTDRACQVHAIADCFSQAVSNGLLDHFRYSFASGSVSRNMRIWRRSGCRTSPINRQGKLRERAIDPSPAGRCDGGSGIQNRALTSRLPSLQYKPRLTNCSESTSTIPLRQFRWGLDVSREAKLLEDRSLAVVPR